MSDKRKVQGSRRKGIKTEIRNQMSGISKNCMDMKGRLSREGGKPFCLLFFIGSWMLNVHILKR